MSIRIMSAIFESESLGPTERLIMLALADHADDDGRCYPSVARICRRTGLSERAVQTNVKKLSDAGYIKVVFGGGKGNSNLYFVSANPAVDAPRSRCTPAADAPQTPQQMRENPAADAPEPSGNHHITINGGGGSARDDFSRQAENQKTDRELILIAIGVDQVSGLTGHGGRQLGTQSDMAEAARWLELPGLNIGTVCAEIRRLIEAKRDGPPKSFRYFTEAMQRLSGALTAPAIQQINPPSSQNPRGNRNDRAAFDRAINQLADDLSAGKTTIDYSNRDPFAARRG